MSRKILTLLALLVGITTSAWAQASQAFQWNASVVITPSLNCTVTQHLTFGSHFSTEGAVRSTGSNYAELMCTTDPGNHVSASLVLPSTLTRAGGGGSVPITYEARSLRLADNASSEQNVNPSTGTPSFLSGTGIIAVSLGRDFGGGDQSVVVNLTGAPAGSYSGVITITLSVL